ncbi:MAG: CFI-box-CTERM domain-containing protein [Bdellovibrionales bacterium]
MRFFPHLALSFFSTLLTLSPSSAQVATPTPQQPGIVFVSVTGASNSVLDEQNQWTIYGGIQRGGPTFSDYTDCSINAPCDTCVGAASGAQQNACNFSGVFPDTRVTFNLQLPANATGRILLCANGQPVSESLNISVPLQATWSQICAVAPSNASATCANDINVTYQLGTGVACNALAAGAINLRFVVRGVDVTQGSTYTATATPGACGAAAGNDQGACFFQLFPGDKKAYLEDVGLTSSFPAIQGSIVRYSALVFFYAQTNTEADIQANDVATFNALTTSASAGTINVAVDGTPDGSIIEDLDNDVRYCFKMGSQDQAGNIERISSTDCAGATLPGLNNDACDRVCMAPSEVLGLLSDKQCFIATAAYGSPLDPHVNRIREFRDRFLIPNWLGRRLVKVYYKVSPPLANWIKKHDSARVVIRGILWPILGWVQLSLLWGWWGVFFPMVILSGVVLWLRRRARWA